MAPRPSPDVTGALGRAAEWTFAEPVRAIPRAIGKTAEAYKHAFAWEPRKAFKSGAEALRELATVGRPVAVAAGAVNPLRAGLAVGTGLAMGAVTRGALRAAGVERTFPEFSEFAGEAAQLFAPTFGLGKNLPGLPEILARPGRYMPGRGQKLRGGPQTLEAGLAKREAEIARVQADPRTLREKADELVIAARTALESRIAPLKYRADKAEKALGHAKPVDQNFVNQAEAALNADVIGHRRLVDWGYRDLIQTIPEVTPGAFYRPFGIGWAGLRKTFPALEKPHIPPDAFNQWLVAKQRVQNHVDYLDWQALKAGLRTAKSQLKAARTQADKEAAKVAVRRAEQSIEDFPGYRIEKDLSPGELAAAQAEVAAGERLYAQSWDKFVDLKNKLVDYWLDTGRIGQREANLYKQRDWAPMHKIVEKLQDELPPEVWSKIASKYRFHVPEKPTKQRRTAGEGAIRNPLESLEAMILLSHHRGEVNKALQQYANLGAEYAPGKDPATGRNAWVQVRAPAPGMEHVVVFPESAGAKGLNPLTGKEQDSVAFWRGGHKYYLRMKPDEVKAAQSMMDVGLHPVLRRLVLPAARMFQLGTTGYNLSFALGVQLPRNLWFLYQNTPYPWRSIAAVPEAVRSRVAGGEIFSRYAPGTSQRYGEPWREIQRAGGGRAMFDISREAPAETVAHMWASRPGARGELALYTLRHPLELLQALENALSIPEQATQIAAMLGTLRGELAKGTNPRAAAIRAQRVGREVSGVYADRGSWARWASIFDPYWGAGVAGLRASWQAAERDPKAYARKIAQAIVVPTIAVTALNMSSPRAEQVYNQVHERQKESAWILAPLGSPDLDRLGRVFAPRIHLNPEFWGIQTLVRHATEDFIHKAVRQDGEEGRLKALDILQAVGDFTLPTMPSMQLPLMLPVRGPLEVATNRSFWNQMPLVPDNSYMRRRVYNRTTQTARTLAKALSGGRKRREEALAIQLEHLLRSYGGTGAVPALATAEKAVTGRTPAPDLFEVYGERMWRPYGREHYRRMKEIRRDIQARPLHEWIEDVYTRLSR